MLGFAPIAANPIAALTAVLITVASPIASTGGIAFGGEATWGQSTAITSTGGLAFGGAATIGQGRSIEATGGIRFSGSPVWTSLNALGASGGITFNGSPTLRAAGKPYPVHAIAESFIIRADYEDFTVTALDQPFTLRGVK